MVMDSALSLIMPSLLSARRQGHICGSCRLQLHHMSASQHHSHVGNGHNDVAQSRSKLHIQAILRISTGLPVFTSVPGKLISPATEQAKRNLISLTAHGFHMRGTGGTTPRQDALPRKTGGRSEGMTISGVSLV